MPGGGVLHFNAIRMRVVGQGNQHLTFKGFDDVYQQSLVPLAMQYPDPRTKLRLANFQSQAGRLRGETTQINEIMRVNDITIYLKPLWEEYPG